MIHFARLRPRLTKLVLPVVLLAVVSAAISFFNAYKMETWQVYSVYIGGISLAIIFWLIPAVRFSVNYIDVTSAGILISRGFGSSKKINIEWSQVMSIKFAGLKGISIVTRDEIEHVIKGYANQRELAGELQRIFAGK